MDKILSIIIPAYNVEKYLRKCLSSMEVKEILDDVEVLVISDGSTDSTAQIVMEYVNKYPGTYYLYEKENGGHGSTINYGIRHANGKYFKVVDGDDWLNTPKLSEYVNMLKNRDEDIIASDYLCIQDVTEKILDEKYAADDKSQYTKTCYISKGQIHNVIKMHSMTIKTGFLKNQGIDIDEHCFYVDAEYITYPIVQTDSVYFYNEFIYMYRLGRNGQSMDIKSMQKRRDQHMHVLESLLRFYENASYPTDEHKKYVERAIAQIVENQFQIYISMGLKKGIFSEMKKWDKDLQKNYPDVYKSTNKKSITMLRNTGYLILPVGAIVYKIVRG